MAKDYIYRNLVWWQRSQTLALRIIQVVRALPSDWGNAVIARQVIASATSVSANIAEGHARFTPNPHRHHLSIAKGSAAETDSWLDLLRRMDHLSAEEEQSLHQECLWIIAALTGKIRDLESRSQTPGNQIHEAHEYYSSPDGMTNTDPIWPFTEQDYL